jgi:hypothetical protein
LHRNGGPAWPEYAADPFIDGAALTAGWNRYSYVRNSPLSYTDPSGFASDLCDKIGKCRSEGITGGAFAGSIKLETVTVFGTRTFDIPMVTFWTTGADTTRPGEGAGGGGAGSELEEVTVTGEKPQEQKPPCEGTHQILDPSLAAISATAATVAKNTTDGIPPSVGSRGIDAVTSARIAPFEQLAANIEWAQLAKVATRASWGVNVINIGAGFRSSVPDGLYAVTDFAVGVGLPFVPWVGIPTAIAYGAHGGSKALVNDLKHFAGSCTRP